MTQVKTVGFQGVCVEGCRNVYPPFSETFWKLSSAGVAVHACKALDHCSLADGLRMKLPRTEAGAGAGAGVGREGAAALHRVRPEAGSAPATWAEEVFSLLSRFAVPCLLLLAAPNSPN